MTDFSSVDNLNGGYETLLRSYDWKYFGCVHYSRNWNQINTYLHMNKFFKKLSSTFPNNKLRLFFTTESNVDTGYHSHFILWFDNEVSQPVRNVFETHFRGKGTSVFGNTWIEPYDPEKGGVGYILKEIHRNIDGYDFLTKNCRKA